MRAIRENQMPVCVVCVRVHVCVCVCAQECDSTHLVAAQTMTVAEGLLRQWRWEWSGSQAPEGRRVGGRR